MIFMFPALMSENVSQQLVPAIAKTLEQYFLQHLGFALSTGSIKIIIDETERKSVDQMKIESDDLSKEELTYIVENLVFNEKEDTSSAKERKLKKDVDDAIEAVGRLKQQLADNNNDLNNIKKDIDKKEDDLSKLVDSGAKPEAIDKLKNEIDSLKTKKQNIKDDIDKLAREIKDADKDVDKKKGNQEEYKGTRGKADVKFDSYDKLGMAPTTVSMTVTATRRYIDTSSGRALPRQEQEELKLLVGVKVIPSIIKNFSSLYETLRSDYYSNLFSYVYKASFRYVARKLFNNKWIKKIASAVDWLRPTGNASLLPGWYANILMSKAGFLDMNAFSKASGTPGYQRYAGSTVVMNLDEEEDMFENAGHVNQLFKMGWKTFVVIDTRQKIAIICSHLDRGMCNRIPLQFLFKAVGADKLYDSLEDLERSTGSMFKRGKFKPMRSVMKKAKGR